MKKLITGMFAISMLAATALPIYGSSIQIKVDNVPIKSDILPQQRNDRTMVPLRLTSENLGAKVDWASGKITLSKGDTKVILKVDSNEAIKNEKMELLDVKPYEKNNRTMVPIRFIAETFKCEVAYKDGTVMITTEPLMIKGIKVDALNYEYHMTMGGSISEMKVNSYNKAIYELLIQSQESKTNAPVKYQWGPDIDTLGAYYKNGQYNFKDIENNDIQEFGIYSLVNANGALGGESQDFPEMLLHDATADEWYVFTKEASESIEQLRSSAWKQGILKEISNNIV